MQHPIHRWEEGWDACFKRRADAAGCRIYFDVEAASCRFCEMARMPDAGDLAPACST